MKVIQVGTFATILALVALALISWESSDKNLDMDTMENTIVILKYKAQEEQGEKAVLELTNLIEKVKREPNFVRIKLHIDPSDNTNILLYEEWEDADYYNTDHMDTDHIKEFMANSRNFLTGPPEITFWKVERDFR